MKSILVRMLHLCVIVGLSSASFSFAQIEKGTIAGTVKDAQGAAVPDAKITVTRTDTQQQRSLVTDKSGSYSAELLTAGTYSVAAEAPVVGIDRVADGRIDRFRVGKGHAGDYFATEFVGDFQVRVCRDDRHRMILDDDRANDVAFVPEFPQIRHPVQMANERRICGCANDQRAVIQLLVV